VRSEEQVLIIYSGAQHASPSINTCILVTYLVCLNLKLTRDLDQIPSDGIAPHDLGHHCLFALCSEPWVARRNDLHLTITSNLSKLCEGALDEARGGGAVSIVLEPKQRG
jgi:hypothetical protein